MAAAKSIAAEAVAWLMRTKPRPLNLKGLFEGSWKCTSLLTIELKFILLSEKRISDLSKIFPTCLFRYFWLNSIILPERFHIKTAWLVSCPSCKQAGLIESKLRPGDLSGIPFNQTLSWHSDLDP